MSKRQRRKKPASAAGQDGPSPQEPQGSLAQVLQEALEVTPEEARTLGARLEHKIEVSVQQSFSGPLPPPHTLAQYERLSPGLLKQIVGLAERQAKHRQELEQVAVRGNTWMGKAGVIGGTVLGLAAMGVIALAILQKAPLEYLAGILLAVATLVGVQVVARRKKARDADKRLRDVQQLFEQSIKPIKRRLPEHTR